MTSDKNDVMATFVHRFVPGSRCGIPALVLFHRTGGDEHDLIGLASSLAPGAALLGLRGPVMEDRKPRFFRRLEKGKFDLEDLSIRIDRLALFIDWATQHYEMKRAVAVGFSNGANMIWATILPYPKLFQGAVLFRPMRAFQPHAETNLEGLPVLVTAGALDSTVPPCGAQEVPSLLESAHGNVAFEWVDAAHDFCEADIDKTSRWLRRTFCYRET
jgi:phospholipase/carboxylesterase